MKTSRNWPDDGVAKLERAVSEWLQTHPNLNPIRIVWGYSNKDDEKAEATESPEFQQPEALLDFRDRSYKIILSASGDSDLYPDHCDITADFAELPGVKKEEYRYQVLPLGDATKIYNIMRCCERGVQLDILPMKDSGSAIAVLGLCTRIPIETLSARILYDALLRLRNSTDLVWNWLTKNKGHDSWSGDGW